MAHLFFLYSTTQKHFCWLCKRYNWIEFILLNIFIFILYFSELYFILYELYKLAVILFLFYFLVHNFGALGIPSLGTQHHCQAGPTATLAGHTGTRPTGQFNGREHACSRCRALTTVLRGELGHERGLVQRGRAMRSG